MHLLVGFALYVAGAWTAAEFVQAWDLQGAELTQANGCFERVMDSKANATPKDDLFMEGNSGLVWFYQVRRIWMHLTHDPIPHTLSRMLET